ncbi:MAG: restriction endonuclease [Gammaproteobacteria bacterium]|nr:restriction endonuclease [Gammaproteobacteria bacterium]MYE28809.1 restriction endonuclease [Gammaproteobacteria bacterium]
MNREQFEAVLHRTAEILTENLRSSQLYRGPEQFEQGVLDMLKVAAEGLGVTVEPTSHAHAFPDIRVNGYGVEVKYSVRDTWSAVGNSVFESMRDPSVSEIYVMFGKVGGNPKARWAKYEDCIKHVRVSNAPRFVVDLDSEESPLFERFDISYRNFSSLDEDGKMAHVRDYWRKRLPPGEHLWWLEPSHTLPINVRLYMNLPQHEKRTLRSEAALLCPQICKGSRAKRKYEDAAMYLLTYHGVFCPQTRDLFTAGSVADHIEPIFTDEPYVSRALRDIETLIVEAAMRLENALFVEYWGIPCPPCDRLEYWLSKADQFADGWTPSEVLFQNV